MKTRVFCAVCFSAFVAVIPSLAAPKGATNELSERQTRRIAYVKRVFVDGYQTHGKKDAKWDAPARDAIAATARFWSEDPDGNDDEIADMFNKSAEAMAAGCDDALVHFARGRAADSRASRELKAREYDKAAQEMLQAKYAPYVRAEVLLGAASWANGMVIAADAAWKDNSEKYMDAGMALMPEVVADQQLPPAQLVTLIGTTGAVSRKIKGDRLVLVEKVMTMLEKSPHPKSLALSALGSEMINYAWDARGSGYANTVTPEGWKLFRERIGLARKLLEEAWKLDQTNCEAATWMLTVIMAQSRPRDEMELWFKRAMKLDPCNKRACIQKMNYLDPKWNGSINEMLEFGHELAKQGNWAGGLPLMLEDAYWTIAFKSPLAKPPVPDPLWFNQPEIWKDVQPIYEEKLRRAPESRLWRTKYMVVAAWTEHWDVANEQLQKLNGKPSRRLIGEAVADVQRKIEEHAKQK